MLSLATKATVGALAIGADVVAEGNGPAPASRHAHHVVALEF